MTETAPLAAKPRQYYLDWLRVISMLTVFFYHTNRLFNQEDWHVKNLQLSVGSTIFENTLGIWMMPLLFVLSGAAVFYSLKSRSGGGFVKERFTRLLIPLLTLGIWIFGPIQLYLDNYTHGNFTGSFWAFLPHFFDGFQGFGGNFAWTGVHLWYLEFLFLYTLLLLPLFLPSGKVGTSLAARLGRFLANPVSLFLLFVPLALATHLTDALGMGFTRQMGGWDMFSYILFLFYGFLLVSSPAVMATVKKYAFFYLVPAAGLTVFWLVLRFIILPTPDTGFFFGSEIEPLMAWLWILAILGLGSRYLTANHRFLSYSNEAVLPFYVLHQPVILLFGFFLLDWNAPVILKYAFIAVCAFTLIMLVYELLVRRLKPLRFLFGMRALKTPAAAAPATTTTAA